MYPRRQKLTAAALSAALFILPACASTAQQPRQQAATPTDATPTLVVLITVDQLRTDYFDTWGDQLTGGLGRLARGGAVFTNGHHDHAVTETAPGHASTLSGRFPRSTGITRNSAGTPDPQSPLLGGAPGAPASPFRFRGGTLVDWIRDRDPRSRALSVSRKDRGAILPIGRQPQEVYWYSANGTLTTSTWYRDTFPSWVRQFNDRRIPHRSAGRSWALLRPDSVYARTGSAADSALLASLGVPVGFPKTQPADSAEAARRFAEFPWVDEYTLDFALAGVEALQLGRGPQTDVLALSLSAMDAVGHRYGPDTKELHDMMLRLDVYLGNFFDSLFRMRDSNRVVIALTGDHGVGPFPEVYAMRTGTPAWRVYSDSLLEPARRLLATRGVDPDALSFDEGMISLSRVGLPSSLRVEDVLEAVAAELRKAPSVLRVDHVRTLATRDTINDAITRRWLHSLPADSPADLVITLRPNSSWGYTNWIGATHGSPHDYDTQVPIIFYGRPFRQGRYDTFTRVVDIGPTLARVVGVPVTEPRIDGRVLQQALR